VKINEKYGKRFVRRGLLASVICALIILGLTAVMTWWPKAILEYVAGMGFLGMCLGIWNACHAKYGIKDEDAKIAVTLAVIAALLCLPYPIRAGEPVKGEFKLISAVPAQDNFIIDQELKDIPGFEAAARQYFAEHPMEPGVHVVSLVVPQSNSPIGIAILVTAVIFVAVVVGGYYILHKALKIFQGHTNQINTNIDLAGARIASPTPTVTFDPQSLSVTLYQSPNNVSWTPVLHDSGTLTLNSEYSLSYSLNVYNASWAYKGTQSGLASTQGKDTFQMNLNWTSWAPTPYGPYYQLTEP